MEAVVTFDYDAQQDDELDLKVGDVIKDVQHVDEGWCEGVLNGKKGMFPDNFVQVREPAKPPPTNDINGGAPQIRAMSVSKKMRRAKVSFSYAADNIDELSLEPGQIVEVLAEEEEGWWRGKLGGKEGVFPSNFVEIIEEIAESAPPAVTSQAPPPMQSAPPNRPPSPVETAPEPQVSKPKMGQPVLPVFDPSQALAKLKKSSVHVEPKKPPPPAAAAPPPSSVSKPKAPPIDKPQSSSSKSVEKAKVTFDYEADNEDELTIKVGEIVEIVNKNTDNDGWWEVRLGERVGLIPDNFVEILAASPPPIRRPSASTKPAQPPPPQEHKPAPIIPNKPPGPAVLKKKPPAPEPGRKPPKPEPHPPPPSATSASTPDKEAQGADFGVPTTQTLDSSAVKSRPKKTARPPSRSNLLQHLEEENGSHGNGPLEAAAKPEKLTPAPAPAPVTDKPSAAPWQKELLEKKKKAPVPKPGPKAALAPKPTTPSKPSITSTATKPAVSRPEPPRTNIEPKPPSSAASAPKESAPPIRRSDTPPVAAVSAPSPTPAATPTASSNEWKEAYENLRDEFEKFKKFVIGEIQTLTDDLDKEIKQRTALEVDIGRLKKSRGFPH